MNLLTILVALLTGRGAVPPCGDLRDVCSGTRIQWAVKYMLVHGTWRISMRYTGLSADWKLDHSFVAYLVPRQEVSLGA